MSIPRTYSPISRRGHGGAGITVPGQPPNTSRVWPQAWPVPIVEGGVWPAVIVVVEGGGPPPEWVFDQGVNREGPASTNGYSCWRDGGGSRARLTGGSFHGPFKEVHPVLEGGKVPHLLWLAGAIVNAVPALAICRLCLPLVPQVRCPRPGAEAARSHDGTLVWCENHP